MLEISPHPMQNLRTRSDSRIITGAMSAIIAPPTMSDKKREVMLDIIEDAAKFFIEGEHGAAAEFMMHAQNLALTDLPHRKTSSEDLRRRSSKKPR